MKYCLFFLLAFPLFYACNNSHPAATTATVHTARADSLRRLIESYIGTKNADIGVAIIGLEDGDTISVKGDQFFTLMSVAKFPQALLLLHLVDEGKLNRDMVLRFNSAELNQPSGSAFRKDHPGNSVEIGIPEALKYSIGQSDNITSNKIFEVEGGPEAVTRYVQAQGISDIRIVTDYAHMGLDSMHRNRATPKAMVQLLQKFYSRQLLTDSSHNMLWKAMVDAVSGPDRLKGGLPAGTVVAHKTGTGSRDEATGLTEALNDVGVVQLPDGRHFAIAVFVNKSYESPEMNATIIAHISKLAWNYFSAKAPAKMQP